MEIKRRSAGVVVLRKADAGFLYLILRAYRNWDFPKGEIESGETPFDAALREVREETTVEDLAFQWGDQWRETAPYNGKVSRYYVAVTQRDAVSLLINPELGHAEHHEFLWVTNETARILVPSRLLPILSWVSEVVAQDTAPDLAQNNLRLE